MSNSEAKKGASVASGEVTIHNRLVTRQDFWSSTLKIDSPEQRPEPSHLHTHLISLSLPQFEASIRQDGRNVYYCRSPGWLSLGMSALPGSIRSSHHCLPGPIGRAQLVQGFENDVLTILGPIACDVDSWNARGSQCQFYGRISREEDPRTTYQCPKSR